MHDLEAVTQATAVTVTDQTITVDLDDGRTITVPTAWYPRLRHATPAERKNYEITPVGVQWPDVEADFSVRGLLLGRMSGESARSFSFWLERRKQGKNVKFADFVKHHRRSARARKTA